MPFIDWLFGTKNKASPQHTPLAYRRDNPVTTEIDLTSPPTGREEEAVAESYGGLSLELGRGDTVNHCCSALSIMQAWARVLDAAVGRTREQIESALPLVREADSVAEILSSHAVKSYEFYSANALWIREGFTIRPEYLEDRADAVRTLDFGDAEKAAKTINSWIDDATRGMIPEVLKPDSFDAFLALIITNAMYLEAKWLHPFEAHQTFDGPFELLGGNVVNVRSMMQVSKLPYAATSDFEMTCKPYEGEELELVIVLPRPGKFESVRESITWSAIRAARAAATANKDVYLRLPKYSVTGSPKVDEVIRARGATDVYEQSAADLSNISEAARQPGRELFVGQTSHVARIDVDEEGTKAAAATVVALRAGCAATEPDPFVLFYVDRPFLYFVCDKGGVPLFGGHVVDPR